VKNKPQPLKIDAYTLPGLAFQLVGLSFTATTKSGRQQFYFWSPIAKSDSFTLWTWRVGSGEWKRLTPDKISPKRLAECRGFWASNQTEIGQWINASKRRGASYWGDRPARKWCRTSASS
jgi:hypothetical protein